jgi:hypothetical protein
MRNQASNCQNPVLDLFTQVGGLLIDVAQLEFQIFDVSDAGKRQNPVQVFPSALGARTQVNLTTLCPGGHKLSTGHFVAEWTPPNDEAIGTHEVRWYFRLTSSSPEQTFKEEFEVLPEASGFSVHGYALVSDFRNEGISVSQVTDSRLQLLIAAASQYVERMTARFFEPRAQTISLDGTGSKTLALGQPIIGIESVAIDSSSYSVADLHFDASLYRVYNRHLTQRLFIPDDRDNPKLEFFSFGGNQGLVWPKGTQNVTVRGVFGYTEPDGSLTGRTPTLIRHVTKLLVMRELPLLGQVDRREDAQRRFRLTSERTRDQSYTLEAIALHGSYTGDPEIDNILVAFQRPADFGAA